MHKTRKAAFSRGPLGSSHPRLAAQGEGSLGDRVAFATVNTHTRGMALAPLQPLSVLRGLPRSASLLTHSGTRVLLALLSMARNDTREAWPSVDTIANTAQMSRRTAQRALRSLELGGFTSSRIVPPGGPLPHGRRARFATTIYRLILENNRAHAKVLDCGPKSAVGDGAVAATAPSPRQPGQGGASPVSPLHLIGSAQGSDKQRSSSSSISRSGGAARATGKSPVHGPADHGPSARVARDREREKAGGVPHDGGTRLVRRAREAKRSSEAGDAKTTEKSAFEGGAFRDELAIGEVFEHWKALLFPEWARLTTAQREIIAARLGEGFTVAELCRAVDGRLLMAYRTDWKVRAYRTSIVRTHISAPCAPSSGRRTRCKPSARWPRAGPLWGLGRARGGVSLPRLPPGG